jgi:homocysteine S-methyltransferase
MAGFPPVRKGRYYLTEGGQETEVMFRHGHDLPEFAMFALLDRPEAMDDLRGMYRRYLETAAANGFVPLMGGLDYRLSPDWGRLIGHSPASLEDLQLRAIDFLRDVARPFEDQIPEILFAGIVGPRGDAYQLNRTITADEAEDYHAAQIGWLKQAGVDLVSALTFNNVPEAVGLSRAAARAGLPVSVSFTLDSTHRLRSGPSLREAIEATDAAAGADRPDFYGLNCSHPHEFLPALEPGDWISRLRALRPNAAMMDKIELCQLGHLEEGDWHELGHLMGDIARRFAHMDVWGGCCGTWDKHLNEIARSVRLS